MNKRFKGSGFDERIISHTKDLIDAGNQLFEVNISAIGKYTDAIISRGNHKHHRAESTVKSSVIDNFF